MKKAAAILIFLALSLNALQAQAPPQNREEMHARRSSMRLSATSVEPEADSVVFERMRARMDSVRNAEKRPTVALVLSGGGAKGAAHVGVLRYLEEVDIPIDMVLGTSMGGLVGGLYALGYSAHELDSLLRVIDWDVALTDEVDQRYESYNVKSRRQKYQVSIPFHYAAEDFKAKVEEGVRYSARRPEVRLGAAWEEEKTDGAVPSSSLNSLPSGIVFGLNVDNIISGKTVGYHGDVDFTGLPIPFFCVASDIVSCKALNWSSGPIVTALRSTMSIPVLFRPVRYKDMILIDGGTRNNFPADLARAMGADIVIGVVLANNNRSYAEINNLADMVWQVIDMLGRDAYEGNSRMLDVLIRPDIHEFNSMSFGRAQIDTIVDRGYRAARACADRIAAVKGYMPDAKTVLQAPKAVDIGRQPIQIHRVFFDGIDGKDAVYLRKETGIRAGQMATAPDLDAATARVFSSDAIEAVNYTLIPDGDGYDIRFHCVKGPVHRFGASARMDSEERVAALLNAGFNVNKLRGPKLDLEARLGEHWYGKARFSLTAPSLPILNLEGKVGYTDANMVVNSHRYDAGFWHNYLDAYFSGVQFKSFDFRAGLRHERFSLDSWLTNSGSALTPDEMQLFRKTYTSFYSRIRRHTLDNFYYPRSGYSIGAAHDYYLGTESAHVISADARAVVPLNDWLDLIPEAWTRHVIDPEHERFYQANFVGGSMAGRYMGQQIPFVGFHDVTIVDNSVFVMNLDLRANIFKNTFLSLQGGYVWSDKQFYIDDLDLSPRYLGAALELGYNSILGPVKGKVEWSDFRGWQAYLSAGFEF